MHTASHDRISLMWVGLLVMGLLVLLLAACQPVRPQSEIAEEGTVAASQASESLTNVTPSEAEAHYNQAVVLYESGEYEQAIARFDEAIELDPRHALAHLKRAITYMNLPPVYPDKMDYTEEILMDLDKAIELDSELGHAYGYRAFIQLMNGGRYDQVFGEMEKAIELDPDDPEADYLLMWLAAVGWRFPEHEEMRGDAAEMHRFRGIFYMIFENFEKAIEFFDKAIALDPGYADAYGDLVYAFVRLGDYEQAIQAREMQLELDPDNPFRETYQAEIEGLKRELKP